MRIDFLQRREPEAVFHARNFVGFNLVEVVVATQHQQPDLGLDDLTQFVFFFCRQHQRLDGLLQWYAQVLRHVGTSAFARCRGFGHGLRWRLAWHLGRQSLGFFHVGRIVAAGAIHNGVFAGGRDDLKLFTQVAANGAAVGRHGPVAQAKTVEDAAVGLRHHLITGLRSGHVAIKTVSILHDELAPAHQAETRPAFVPEFGLNLVQVDGQLLVALDVLARDVRHHLFAGGLNDEVSLMPVLDAKQFGAHLGEAAGLLPKLGRLNYRHAELHRTGAVHLFAHDGLDLADNAQPHRHIAVNASPELLDHAGAQHEFVAGNLGVGGCFLQS